MPGDDLVHVCCRNPDRRVTASGVPATSLTMFGYRGAVDEFRVRAAR
jgi:hypothetical protein